jgi:DNA-binding SARP family transcriptional activator
LISDVCGPDWVEHSSNGTQKRRTGVTVRLLGGFEILVDDEPLNVNESCARLVGYLALADRPVERAVVAGVLWPDCGDERACANLRTARWRLAAAGPFSIVETVGSRVGLHRGVSVDARDLEAYGWRLVESGVHATLRPDLLFSELLAGWYDDWVIFERERRQQIYLRFAECLVYELIKIQRLTEALDVALRLVDADSFRASGQKALLSVYLAEGNVSQAQAQYERHRLELGDQFGSSPTFHLVDIQERIVSE